METYISILRGINVSGQKKIQMADLKVLYEELKFKDVITYIQSGNVIFKTDKKLSSTEIVKKIEKKIFEKFKFDVPVIIRTIADMKKVQTVNPFIKQKGIDIERLYVTFLAELPKKTELEKIGTLDFSPEKFLIIGKEIYLHCPNGYGRTKLNNNFFENKLKVVATTRNWNTVNKLVEIES
ncbi:MAG: DUF1697 domain-containing protein [Bacteroidetes bacterium]|nr:MAG: DUF1697 domain-containing protein [Bacteroidota bacterium]